MKKSAGYKIYSAHTVRGYDGAVFAVVAGVFLFCLCNRSLYHIMVVGCATVAPLSLILDTRRPFVCVGLEMGLHYLAVNIQ